MRISGGRTLQEEGRGSTKALRWACAWCVQGSARLGSLERGKWRIVRDPRSSEGAEQNLVGCPGEFGSLREMGTLWRIIKLAGYQIVQPHFYIKKKKNFALPRKNKIHNKIIVVAVWGDLI